MSTMLTARPVVKAEGARPQSCARPHSWLIAANLCGPVLTSTEREFIPTALLALARGERITPPSSAVEILGRMADAVARGMAHPVEPTADRPALPVAAIVPAQAWLMAYSDEFDRITEAEKGVLGTAAFISKFGGNFLAPAGPVLDRLMAADRPVVVDLDTIAELMAEAGDPDAGDASSWPAGRADSWRWEVTEPEAVEDRLELSTYLEGEAARYRATGTDVGRLICGAFATLAAEAKGLGARTAGEVWAAREADADELGRHDDERERAWQEGYASGALTHCM